MDLNRSILRLLADSTEERVTFAADRLNMSLEDFQIVVEKVQDAYAVGYIRSITEPHQSSRTGLYDQITAERLTRKGREALDGGLY